MHYSLVKVNASFTLYFNIFIVFIFIMFTIMCVCWFNIKNKINMLIQCEFNKYNTVCVLYIYFKYCYVGTNAVSLNTEINLLLIK